MCTLEVGEFIENDESACLIGLLPHTPLHIEIQLNTESKFPLVRGVTAFQEVLGAVQPPVPVKFGLRCYIPRDITGAKKFKGFVCILLPRTIPKQA